MVVRKSPGRQFLRHFIRSRKSRRRGTIRRRPCASRRQACSLRLYGDKPSGGDRKCRTRNSGRRDRDDHRRPASSETAASTMSKTIDLAAEPYAFTLKPRALRAPDHRHAAGFSRARRLWGNARQRRFATAPDHRTQSPAAGGLARRWSARPSYTGGPSARPVRSAAGQEDSRPKHDHDRRRGADGPHSCARRGGSRHHSGALSRAWRAGDRQARQGRVPRHRSALDPAAPRTSSSSSSPA